MARLTTFSRLLITIAIVVGAFFLLRQFLPQLRNLGGGNKDAQTEQPAEPTAASESAPPASSTASGSSAANFTPRSFDFTAPAPVNGKLKGVVELGATGFNSFIIRIDDQKRWKLEKAEFGASLVYENMATEEDIKKGLKSYIAEMLAFGVGPKDIHFVVSSGAKKAESTQKISNALRSMKYYVNEVTPTQEAQLGLRASQPQGFGTRSFVLDIGSGNTKIAWANGNSVTGLEAPGAKYFQDNISKDEAYRRTFDLAKQVPSNLRQTCFIIGGVPFELAKQHRNGKERFTVLKAPGSYEAKGEKQVAGLNIYDAVADATNCQQFVFDWDANFTIGFLLNL